jgi:hypothetical protein
VSDAVAATAPGKRQQVVQQLRKSAASLASACSPPPASPTGSSKRSTPAAGAPASPLRSARRELQQPRLDNPACLQLFTDVFAQAKKKKGPDHVNFREMADTWNFKLALMGAKAANLGLMKVNETHMRDLVKV